MSDTLTPEQLQALRQRPPSQYDLEYQEAAKICSDCHEQQNCPNMSKACCGLGFVLRPVVSCKLNKWTRSVDGFQINGR